MSLQKQLAELIQEQQQLGSIAKTRYCITYVLQPSFPTLILEAQVETSDAPTFTVSVDHINALTSSIISSKGCMPCECKRRVSP